MTAIDSAQANIAQARTVIKLIILKGCRPGVSTWAHEVGLFLVKELKEYQLDFSAGVVRIARTPGGKDWEGVLYELQLYGYKFVSLDDYKVNRVNIGKPNEPEEWADCLDLQLVSGTNDQVSPAMRTIAAYVDISTGTAAPRDHWAVYDVAAYIAGQLSELTVIDGSIVRIFPANPRWKWTDVLRELQDMGHTVVAMDRRGTNRGTNRLNVNPDGEENMQNCFDMRIVKFNHGKDEGDNSPTPDLDDDVPVVKKTQAEMVAELDLRLVTLRAIEFEERETQTIGYARRVKEWFKQWTVENNYDPVMVLDGDTDAAVREWRKYFEPQLRSVVGEANMHADWQDDFQLKFWTHTLPLGQQAKPGPVSHLGQTFKTRGD